MKILFAATEEQEERLDQLTNYFYTNIFPYHFDNQQMNELSELKVLAFTQETNYNGTLETAATIIIALETLVAIIETNRNKPEIPEDYYQLFEKNVQILNRYYLFFPFTLEQFVETKNKASIFMNPVNSFLM